MVFKSIIVGLLSLCTAIGHCQETFPHAFDKTHPNEGKPAPVQTSHQGFDIESEVQDLNARDHSYPATHRSTVARGRDWNIESVLQQIEEETPQQSEGVDTDSVWWTPHVIQSVNSGARPVQVNVGDLILMALEHSAKVNVARTLPQIRETAITGAQAEFDWNRYIDARWVDTSDPVGSVLTVGAGADRFREHNFSIDAGFRRKFFNGADFYTYQRVGHVTSNSTFFVPNDQATSRIVLGFTQPLMRGRGRVYNTSLILLAEIDTGSAVDEFHRQLQAHLLEVARGYWALYLERTNLAQKVNLYLKTQEIANQLNSRANIDAQRSQVISANAAMEARRSELIRARAAVKNAETRLRALINSPALSDTEAIEMIPAEHPSNVTYPADHAIEFEIALQHRPEIAAALKGIRAACIRLQMSDHEILPTLNLVTETYVSGLRGDSDISNAWKDQFQVGEPGYSVGLQYEVPIGRRAAHANRHRRQVEVRQLQEQYRATLELIRAEVEVAVRELKTSYKELHAKHRGLKAAEAEAETLAARWHELGDQGSTGGLLLESLLRSQERVAQFEYEFAKAQMTYSLALINLRHANGTLFQTQGNAAPVQPQSQQQPTPAQPQPTQQQQPGTKRYPKELIVNSEYHRANQSWQSDPKYQQPAQLKPTRLPEGARTAANLHHNNETGHPQQSGSSNGNGNKRLR